LNTNKKNQNGSITYGQIHRRRLYRLYQAGIMHLILL